MVPYAMSLATKSTYTSKMERKTVIQDLFGLLAARFHEICFEESSGGRDGGFYGCLNDDDAAAAARWDCRGWKEIVRLGWWLHACIDVERRG